MARFYVPIWGTNKKALIDTDAQNKTVLGQNLYYVDPTTGNHVLLQAADILNAGTVQALASGNLVNADNPGSKIGSTNATAPSRSGGTGFGTGTTLTGDVAASITGPGTFTVTINPNVVSNAKLAKMAANTVKMNNTGALANAQDVSTTNLWANGNLSQVPAQTIKGNNTLGVGNVVDMTIAQTNTLLGTITTSTTAGGDLSGTYPNPTVAKINGATLGTVTPTNNAMLVADGSQWFSVVFVGDVTYTSLGLSTIGNNKVTNAKLAQMATMTLKGNNTGGTANAADLTVSQVSSMLGIWNMLSASSDQTVTNNSTLQNDTALTFAMAASTNYRFRGRVWLDGSSTTPGMKYAFSGPTAPNLVRILRADNANGGAPAWRAIDTAIPGSTTLTVGTTALGEMIEFDGIVQNGTNAGTFVFQFAQSVATAAQSVVRRAGSYLEWSVA